MSHEIDSRTIVPDTLCALSCFTVASLWWHRLCQPHSLTLARTHLILNKHSVFSASCSVLVPRSYSAFMQAPWKGGDRLLGKHPIDDGQYSLDGHPSLPPFWGEWDTVVRHLPIFGYGVFSETDSCTHVA